MPLASLSHRLVKKQVKLFILWHFQVLRKLEVELVGQCELFFSVKSFVWSQAGAGGSELQMLEDSMTGGPTHNLVEG